MAYEKDHLFYNFYKNLKNQNVLYKDGKHQTAFVEQKKDTDWSFALYSIRAPFELLHADVANIKIFSKSTADPSFVLLIANLFTPILI